MQLTERRRGNERYHVKDFRAAKHSYERAKSILDLIKGAGPAEQEEINVNRVAMLLNLAALFLATKEHQAAVQACTEALELDGGSSKALLRRAKAATRMHDYQVLSLLGSVSPRTLLLSDYTSSFHKALTNSAIQLVLDLDGIIICLKYENIKRHGT